MQIPHESEDLISHARIDIHIDIHIEGNVDNITLNIAQGETRAEDPGTEESIQDEPAEPEISNDRTPPTDQQQDILRLFAQVDKIGSTDLQELLGLMVPTGSRRLADLAAAGYIAKSGKKYTLTSEGQLMLSYLMNSGV